MTTMTVTGMSKIWILNEKKKTNDFCAGSRHARVFCFVFLFHFDVFV